MRASLKGVLPEWFTPEIYKDESEPVAFHLTPLDGFGRANIKMQSMAARNAGLDLELAGVKIIETAFRLGVTGWRHVEDIDKPGKDLAFSKSAMGKIHEDLIIEVAARVLQISELTEDEVKNSGSPSSSAKS